MVGTDATVREILVESVTVILKVFLIESTVVSSVPFDSDSKESSGALILSLFGKGFVCCGRLDEVDILKAGEMIDKKDCATKTFVCECACGLWNKAWLGRDDVVTGSASAWFCVLAVPNRASRRVG